MKSELALFVAALAACAVCRADTVYLTNGGEVDGTIIEDNNTTVAIQRANGSVQSFRKSDVDAVVYEARKPAPKKVEPPAAPEKKEAAPAKEGEPQAGEGESKEGEAAKPKEGETGAAKEGEAAKPAEGEAKPAEGEAKPKEGETVKEAKDDKGKKEAGDGKTASKEGEKKGDKKEPGKEEWSPPPGLSNFPKNAKRLAKEKEEAFMAALARLATTEEAPRVSAKAEIAALGTGALPYVVAGCHHVNVEARAACMSLVGQLNGRSATKQTIEVFYAAMPESGEPATYQVPFIRAIKSTLSTITGQSFITVEPDRPLVQEGLKRYIKWYEENYDRLPPQLGEEPIEATDPDYMDKLKKARALELKKKSWPRPPMPADITTTGKPGPGNSRPQPTERDLYGRGSQELKASIPTVKREDVGRR